MVWEWPPAEIIGDQAAIFEATHGTAPKYADQDRINPGVSDSLRGFDVRLSGLGGGRSQNRQGHEKTIFEKIVTYDLARQMEGAREVRCSEFASAVIENL